MNTQRNECLSKAQHPKYCFITLPEPSNVISPYVNEELLL